MEPFKADPFDWEIIESESEERMPLSAAIRELRDRVAQLEAIAAATTPPPAEPPDAPQTLHTVALGMVDTLERLPNPPLPEILSTIRRAIREPMATGEGPVATDEEIAVAADQCLTPGGARRAIYNLGRQHATTCPHIRQGDSGSQYCDLARQTAEPAPLPPLEVGQIWRRRDGEIWRVIEEATDLTGSQWAELLRREAER